MKLTKDDISKIAQLARLQFNETELSEFAQSMSRIVSFVNELDAVDTSGVEPMAHPLHASQRLREDVVTATDEHKVFQKNAPKVEAGLYLVPKVMD